MRGRFMRKLIIIGIIFLVFAVGIVITLMNLNTIVNKNKQTILARTENILQRKISVDDIRVSLWRGIGILLKDVRLSEDQSFSSEDFLHASSLQINVRILPLLRKELQVKKILLFNPVISIIRNEKGEYNFESIARKEGHEKEPSAPIVPAPPPAAEKQRAPLPLLISLANIKNGEIRYIDQTAKGQQPVTAQDLDLEISDISFERPIGINLYAKLLGAQERNITLEGGLGPLGPKFDLTNIAAQGKVRLGPINLDNLIKVLPQIAGWEGIASTLKDYGLSGTLELKANIMGSVDRGKMPRIQGKVEIQDGALANVNIPEIVLTNITGVSGLSALISTSIKKSRFAHLFEAKDTEFEQLKGSFLVDEGKIKIKELILTAAEYTVQGEGWVGLDKRIDFSTHLILSQKFSEDIMDNIREAKYIADEENRLTFPFHISGKIPHIRSKPDIKFMEEKLGKALLDKGVEKIIKKTLEGIFGR